MVYGGGFYPLLLKKLTMRYLLIILLFSSCQSVKYVYAKAMFTSKEGKIKVEVLEPFKPVPDTTVIGTVIRRK